MGTRRLPTQSVCCLSVIGATVGCVDAFGRTSNFKTGYSVAGCSCAPWRASLEHFMKRWFSSSHLKTLLSSFAALCSLLCIAQVADAEVGRTPGSPGVNREGAFTYNIPIWAPPGPKGLQPNISLTYNSQGGNGYLGVGWSLGGLSSIYRCNKSFAQDGTGGPVTLTASDVFCLDGQRLRLTGGTYGVAGSTYTDRNRQFLARHRLCGDRRQRPGVLHRSRSQRADLHVW